jgi:hypothetical protein
MHRENAAAAELTAYSVVHPSLCVHTAYSTWVVEGVHVTECWNQEGRARIIRVLVWLSWAVILWSWCASPPPPPFLVFRGSNVQLFSFKARGQQPEEDITKLLKQINLLDPKYGCQTGIKCLSLDPNRHPYPIGFGGGRPPVIHALDFLLQQSSFSILFH